MLCVDLNISRQCLVLNIMFLCLIRYEKLHFNFKILLFHVLIINFLIFGLTSALVPACGASSQLRVSAGSPPRRPTASHCLRRCCRREPEWIAAPAGKWALCERTVFRPQSCCPNRPRCPCCPIESYGCPRCGAAPAPASCCPAWSSSRPASSWPACLHV